jgi:hypothetical protein
MMECTFYLTTFVLRSTWANRHNSRQGCNLEELINQSELAHDLASAQGIRVIEKLANIEVGVFHARNSYV